MDDRTIDEVARWRADHPALSITLIRGNHDRSAGDPPASWGIDCLSGPVEHAPFRLMHEPPDADDDDAPTLAGHIHPCVRLHGRARRALRAPCFYFSRSLALLPAFGSFTGAHPVTPKVGDQVFAVGEGRVLPLTTS